MANIINWSEVSRVLTSDSPKGEDRTRVGKNYSGKKYRCKAERLKKLEKFLERWLQK
jgi:hypothetical protein